ncbi:MAG: hypothetical protein H7Y38_05135 [Armatimonadetes bacterium]|nr:hypothetical protein [Armatimonadota bacterium]
MEAEVEELKQNVGERFGANDPVTTLINRLGASTRSEVVFGTTVERGAVTLIPVARISYGMGFGFGAKSNGGGGGGGLIGEPVGLIEVSDSGSRFLPISTPASRIAVVGALALAALVAYWFSSRGKGS